MSQVVIKKGVYAKKPVVNTVFELIKPVAKGSKGMFVTVDGEPLGFPNRNLRIIVDDERDVEYTGIVDKPEMPEETDAEAMDRIAGRFKILDDMSDAVANGVVRGLIVSGPPGVGKSFGVEKVLDEYDAMSKLSGEGTRTEIVKGSMTPIGLFQTLYHNSSAGNILVFDDCDSVLFDEVCLNMLKATLDSGKKRTITWKAESSALRREGIPERFEFRGGCIFITNVNFENVKSKKIKDHLAALMSRCHYIDLEMDSERDRFLRINQIVRDGMLDEYEFGEQGNNEVVDFMVQFANRLREISLRMVLKIADLRKMSPDNWQNLAEATCMKRIGA